MPILYAAFLVALCVGCATTRPDTPDTPDATVRQIGVSRDGWVLFSSTRDYPTADLFATEIYLMNGDGSEHTRLTSNEHADFFASLSPDGSTVLFETNRLRTPADPRNISDLFLMNRDGSDQRHLTRGASGTWSPDGTFIAFHASASGSGVPISSFPGAASSDSDIFVMQMGPGANHGAPRNITNDPDCIDDDPDWSPDGTAIVFTSHPLNDAPTDAIVAEIFVIDPRTPGSVRKRLTFNEEEERAPSWSPDGTKILYSCKGGGRDFEICVMNADGSNQVQLTDNDVADLTSAWSPDGKRIVFQRAVSGRASLQLMLMNADGSDQQQWSFPPGQNAFPSWSGISR